MSLLLISIPATKKERISTMKKNSLSKRLLTIANEIKQAHSLLDIGTDHGYLPIHLVQSGKIKQAIAADINEGPLTRARENIAKANLTTRIQTRMGNGFSVLEEGETVDVVVIAGMGGALITDILQQGVEAQERAKVERFVLQPNVGSAIVRQWLFEHGWQLMNEQLVEEDERIYEILTAKRGDAQYPYRVNGVDVEAGFLFGPWLMKERSSLFKKKWRSEQQKWEQILAQLHEATESVENVNRKAHYEKKLGLLKEVLNDETG